MRETDDRAAISTANVEPNSRHAPMGKEAIARFTAPVHIRVISYRKHRHDTDGISAKAVIDGLVRIGVIADDASEFVKEITFESRKSSEEKTEIVITEWGNTCKQQ